MYIFTELTLWADSVYKLQCPCDGEVVPLFFNVLLLPFTKVNSQMD